MSGPFGSSQWQYSSGGGTLYDYTIGHSLRLSDISGSYLYQTEDFATDNTWTFSCWIKRNLFKDQAASTDQQILHVHNNDPWEAFRWVGADDSLSFTSYGRGGGTYAVNIYTYPIFRDPSSWYHVMFVYDAGNGTADDRQRIYVNGERMSVQGGRYGSGTGYTNTSTTANSALGAGYAISIGSRDGNNPDADFQIAEVHFLDGYALTPSSFGETKEGVWVPIEYTGSYGQGGSYLNFADSSDLGKDVSGQANHWSSGAAITAHDQLTDTPTLNFCTLNPLTCGTYPVLTDGNLRIQTMYSADLSGCSSTWAVDSGKWYWEVHMEGNTLTYPIVGITDPRQIMGGGATKGTFYSLSWRRGTAVSLATTYMGTITKRNSASTTNNDIIMFALDAGARKIWIGKNGTWNSDGDPATGANPDGSWTLTVPVSPSIMGYQSQGVGCVFNFGQDGTFAGNQTAQGNEDGNGIGDFYYSPPSGFLAMATSNLTAEIDPASGDKPSNHFNIVTYTGTGTTNSITGVGFQPSWVWGKQRNGVNSHELYDVVRGVNQILYSDLTDAEETNANGISSFDSDGFTVAGNTSINGSGNTVVAWNWLAGGTAVSNTAGSITSNVSVNTEAGISIIGYTGNGTNGATVGHGLGVVPDFLIIRRRTPAEAWPVWAGGAGFSNTQYLRLNGTNAKDTAGTLFNSTTPTDTVVTLGTGDFVNTNTRNYIMYAFASVEGFSKVGKYRGFSSSNGAYVHCGFRPAWVLIKSESSGTDWCIYDNRRLGYNVDNNLQRNTSAAEQTDDDIDFLAHGFKLRRSSSNFNNTSHDYVFLAFAEQPFKFANAR